MPELPEVQIVVDGLNQKITRKTIGRFVSRDIKVSKLSPADKKLIRSKVQKIRRIGKAVIIDLDNQYSIIIHLKMTGQLVFVDRQGKRYEGGHPEKSYQTDLPNKHTRAVFEFSDGTHLFFNDLRRFGWIKLVPTKEVENDSFVKAVGPDPTSPDFKENEFIEKVQSRKIGIYSVITNQKIISGVGNIYANEALWLAKILPTHPGNKLSIKDINGLLVSIKQVLTQAIRAGGTSYSTFVNVDGKKGDFLKFLKVYQHEGDACPRRDGGIIQRKKIGGRSTFFCPKCQK